MKFKQSNQAVFLFFVFPLSLSMAWHFGARETHIMSIKRAFWLASCPHLVWLVWSLCTCFILGFLSLKLKENICLYR